MIELDGVTQHFRRRRRDVVALGAVDLRIEKGEFVCLQGPSGSGKTTLLLLAGGMLRPTAGKVRLDDTDLYDLAPGPRAAFRARHIGFVFQMFHLVPYLDLVGNVLLGGGRLGRERDESEALLARVGLAPRAHHRPAELSAGERQRVAVARALLPSPSVILADEPTGNLDPENAALVLELLAGFHAGGGTVLLVTHGAGPTVHADRVLHIEAGRIVE